MAEQILPKDIIDAVEGNLQRATLDGMRVHTAVGRSETGSARFSNQSILRYADIAAILIASRAKAESLRPLFETRTPSGGEFDLSSVLRLRGVSPNVGGALARRRTRTSDDYYSSRGAEPTPEHPAYIFEGGEFFIEGGPRNPAGSEASFVAAPLTTFNTVTGVTLSGANLSTDAPGVSHEETIAYLVDTNTSEEISVRLLDTSVSGTDVDTTAPDGTYELTYNDHACSKLGVRHQTAVVEMASALCFASLGEGDALEASLSNYQDDLQSDVMAAFDLRDESSDG